MAKQNPQEASDLCVAATGQVPDNLHWAYFSGKELWWQDDLYGAINAIVDGRATENAAALGLMDYREKMGAIGAPEIRGRSFLWHPKRDVFVDLARYERGLYVRRGIGNNPCSPAEEIIACPDPVARLQELVRHYVALSFKPTDGFHFGLSGVVARAYKGNVGGITRVRTVMVVDDRLVVEGYENGNYLPVETTECASHENAIRALEARVRELESAGYFPTMTEVYDRYRPAVDTTPAAPAATQGKAAETPVRSVRLEFHDEKSHKYWEAETTADGRLVVRNGAIGARCKDKPIACDDAGGEFDKRVAKKRKEGYAEPEEKKSDNAHRLPMSPKNSPDRIALDGSSLPRILALIGVDAKDPERSETVKKYEKLLGARLPEETRTFLATEMGLTHPSAEDHSEVSDFSSLEVPSADGIPEWLAGLGKGMRGKMVALEHFCGLIRIGQQLQQGDYMWALAASESFDGGLLGGAFYFQDDGDFGPWGGGSLSGLLAFELEKFCKERSGAMEDLDEDEREDFDVDDLTDCFILRYDGPEAPAEPLEMPAATKAAFDAFVAKKTEEARSCAWVAAFCADEIDADVANGLPDAQAWAAEKKDVAKNYGRAMYWLTAHALLDHKDGLAEAIALTADHPSANVQALRGYLQKNDVAKAYAKQRAKLATFEEPARPASVPSEARWNAGETEWELGTKNDKGQCVGEWRWWKAPAGYLVCQTLFDDKGGILSYKRFHPNGEVSRYGRSENGKNVQDVWVRSTAKTTEGFPDSRPEAWRAEHRVGVYPNSYDCFDRDGNPLFVKTPDESPADAAPLAYGGTYDGKRMTQVLSAKGGDLVVKTYESGASEPKVETIPCGSAEAASEAVRNCVANLERAGFVPVENPAGTADDGEASPGKAPAAERRAFVPSKPNPEPEIVSGLTALANEHALGELVKESNIPTDGLCKVYRGDVHLEDFEFLRDVPDGVENVLILGNLKLEGGLVNDFEGRNAHLLVSGDVDARFVESYGNGFTLVSGKLRVRDSIYGEYNDGMVCVKSGTTARFVLNNDHCLRLNLKEGTPEADLHDLNYDDADLTETFVPECFGDDGEFDKDKCLNLVSEGKSPLLEKQETE